MFILKECNTLNFVFPLTEVSFQVKCVHVNDSRSWFTTIGSVMKMKTVAITARIKKNQWLYFNVANSFPVHFNDVKRSQDS